MSQQQPRAEAVWTHTGQFAGRLGGVEPLVDHFLADVLPDEADGLRDGAQVVGRRLSPVRRSADHGQVDHGESGTYRPAGTPQRASVG